MVDDVEREARKDITIRGVDSILYNRAAEIARRTGKTMGEIINESLRLFIDVTEGIKEGMQPLTEGFREAGRRLDFAISSVSPTIISDLSELEVNKADLEQFGRRVIFQNIDKLVFSEDVDPETFEKYVALIRNCDVVKPPRGVSKLLMLSRCRGIGKLLQS